MGFMTMKLPLEESREKKAQMKMNVDPKFGMRMEEGKKGKGN